MQPKIFECNQKMVVTPMVLEPTWNEFLCIKSISVMYFLLCYVIGKWRKYSQGKAKCSERGNTTCTPKVKKPSAVNRVESHVLSWTPWEPGKRFQIMGLSDIQSKIIVIQDYETWPQVWDDGKFLLSGVRLHCSIKHCWNTLWTMCSLHTGFAKLLAVNIAAISVKFPEFGGYVSAGYAGG